MSFRPFIAAIGIGLNTIGCSTPQGAVPGERRASDQEINHLAKQALTAPATEDRAAAALAVADMSTANLADAVAGIDTAMRVVAHNLANADTSGYKRSIARCTSSAQPIVQLDMSQGALENTGRPLDVGISGVGFLKVRLEHGEAYTRCGNLFLDKDGNIVVGLKKGLMIEPPINIPPGTPQDRISIGEDGTVAYIEAGATAATVAGQISLYRFQNSEYFDMLAPAIFAKTDQSGEETESKPCDDGTGKLLSGFLECSNVNVERERIRITYLQNWRDAIVRATDPKFKPAVADAKD